MGNGTFRERRASDTDADHVNPQPTRAPPFQKAKSYRAPLKASLDREEDEDDDREGNKIKKRNSNGSYSSMSSKTTLGRMSIRHALNRQREGRNSFTIETNEIPLVPKIPTHVASKEELVEHHGYATLPRGGYIVRTKALGSVQFGIPPETIKDSLSKGLTVPKHFVIQGDMFDRKVGLSEAEFEFPIYYQFFVCRSKVNIITFRDHEKRIRQALQETLIGPGTDCNVSEDFPEGTSPEAFPNFEAESCALDTERNSLHLDDVVSFTLFDEISKIATIGPVSIRLFSHMDPNKNQPKLMFEVSENGEVMARVPANVKLKSGGSVAALLGRDTVHATRSKHSAKQQAKKNYELEEELHSEKRCNELEATRLGTPPPPPSTTTTSSADPHHVIKQGHRSLGKLKHETASSTNTAVTNRRGSTSVLLPNSISSSASLPPPSSLPSNSAFDSGKNHNFAPFDIPVFGITMMGASHGFDPLGRTTGFVLWMNRRGLMVDPPPDSSQILEIMGIPPLAIEAVILTHIHADHDAGTFQKILRTKQIQLLTTRTIERSFIKKYSSITGFEPSFLRSLFQFLPVQCGDNAAIHMYGGELRFHYSLHTIPCIGLTAHYGSQSVAYSADTKFDPVLVQTMLEKKQIGQIRAEQLSTFPWNHTVILYEMGVPPIHTSKEMLRSAALDEKHYRKGRPLKERLFVVHSSESKELDFANKGKDWLTIRITAAQGKDKKLSEITSVLSNVDWLKPLGSDLLTKVAKMCRNTQYEPGQVISKIRENESSASVWIVTAGQVVTQEFNMEDVVLAVGESFGLGGLLEALLEESPSGSSALLQKIPGVPLSLEILELLNVKTKGLRRGMSVAKVVMRPNEQVFKARSRCWVIEISPQTLLKLLGKDTALKTEITLRLRRFIGWPNDARWCTLQRNDQLMKLLNNQFAVREFLQSLSEDFVTLPKEFVIQSGRMVPHSAFFIKEGVVRVTPLVAHTFSFRANGVQGHEHSQHPFQCARGTLVGDFNSLIKGEPSPFRIVCTEDCEVFHFQLVHLMRFFEEFPGIKFQLIDRIMVGWMLQVKDPLITRFRSDEHELLGSEELQAL